MISALENLGRLDNAGPAHGAVGKVARIGTLSTADKMTAGGEDHFTLPILAAHAGLGFLPL